jgi:O-antigen/teichoic acid export membrane protein
VIFLVIVIEWGFASWLASNLYSGEEYEQDNAMQGDETASATFREFWTYCMPFIPFIWLSFAQDISAVWMLQHWGGSVEQAYYGIGMQFSSVVIVLTTSVLRIFWKEIAEAYHCGDQEKVRDLYFKVTRGLYFGGAVFAGALVPWSREIIVVFLGEAYLAGTITLMLMFIYTVHQSMGQLGSVMLLATENTKAQVLLGMIFSSIGIVTIYIMLAPEAGLQLAASGLAIKMVLVQFLAVNAKAWYISRVFSWKFDWNFQFVALGYCLSAGWLCKYIMSSIFELGDFFMLIISSVFYFLLVFMLVVINPVITGMNKTEINTLLKFFLNLKKVPINKS